MKIAMIGHKRVPSREGGVEIVVEELGTRMVQKGHLVDLYNRKSTIKEQCKEYKGMKIFWIPTPKSSTLNAFVYSILAMVRALFGKYDLIHFHAEGPAVMVALAKLFRIPVVVTIHGLDWQRAKWGGFATRYLLLGEKIAARFADEIIVLSRKNQQYFKEKYDRDTQYIPNGVNIYPTIPADQINRKWGLEKEGYILFLARLVPEKGVHYLIQAFYELETDKKLVIAGKIEKENLYMKKICKMAAKDNRIIMTDFVEGRILEELFSNCFLYVLPSDVEGMAISLLEALSYGCRCLVSDIHENKEAAWKYAIYFKKGNVQSLRNHIKEILNSDEEKDLFDREEMIRFVSDRYSWDHVTYTTLELYESVVASGN